ncbi:hypothetical protein DSOL_0367 [Desulfosporosinus metallidurans]|uniref:Uncharacterized protein n=1 Tax=Desulfosporosinus metallidurans TaxID=1888891 RepID=A0A1Q8R233_9FIRM|nr:hypothetical protein DSOL_0367 [Desulfosporosinus metallidurans]
MASLITTNGRTNVLPFVGNQLYVQSLNYSQLKLVGIMFNV